MNKRQRKKALKRLLRFPIDMVPTMKGYREVIRIEAVLRYYRDTAVEAIKLAPKVPWIERAKPLKQPVSGASIMAIWRRWDGI